ncbi:PAS domain-containing sensor histidine kinase [Inquilinus sp. KBS0705]|nr:PAS domain-containing sensor histidine kinase [Inquilinus sp. KBS0705]
MDHTPEKPYQQFLKGGGEMGELTRKFNWSSTVLGDPEQWPQSLLTTISIILNAKFPMFLWWGPQLIQFYNDAYRPSLGINGKHPKALGQRGADCWKEIWPVISPLIDQVMSGGESTWSQDQLIPIFRNDRLEDVYWTFSYAPVIGESGKPEGVLVICYETTNTVKSFRAVEEAKRELEFGIEAADLGTWDLNPLNGRFTGNNRLKEWFGLPLHDQIELSSAIEVMIPEDRERVAKAIQKAMQRGSDGNYDATYTIVNQHNKKRKTVKAKGKAMFDDEGNAYRFSGILQDITDDFAIEKRKDEFISVASHELKTPITSLNASMQILQKLVKTEVVSDRMRMFVGKANSNLKKLLHLLDDLLNVTKLQQGQLAMNRTRFNLAELVKDSFDHVNQDDSHDIILMGDAELMIDADYRRIDQVLVNFVNNAIKYSPQSKRIEVTISREGNNAKVAVRDFGIGISEEKLPHLFDRYYRVDSLGHQFSGLGLGLYISAEIIQMHEGKIGVESVRGECSTFWFTLPIQD